MSYSKNGSVPEKKPGFTIAASPLNTVKFELGIVLVVGLFLILIVSGSIESLSIQMLVLSAYGLTSTLWLIYRTKKIVTSLENNGETEN